ncbi:MAG: transmembrane 220 family protein [Pseudomonadota bacterium]
MRIVNGVLAIFLALFALAQVNDPDGVFWAAVYGAGALWCLVAALKPAMGAFGPIRLVFGLTLVASIVGTAWFWPKTSGWWRQDVWWETETAREGMGMMILLICLVVAGLVILRRSETA